MIIIIIIIIIIISLRVDVGLLLGSELCQPHRRFCGSSVDARGSHALSCRRNTGRSHRQHFVNDLIWRSLSKAGFPSIKEPQGLLRADGKCPDGLTLTPGKEGRCATWDVTVTNTIAASYLSATSAWSSSQEERRQVRRNVFQLPFFPLAFETFGPINQVSSDFLCATNLPHFWWPSWNVFSLSTSFCFYSEKIITRIIKMHLGKQYRRGDNEILYTI